MEAVLDFGRGRQKWLKSCNGEYVGWGGGGVSLQLILITWPQAVRQMRNVGRGEVGGGEGWHEADNSS